MTGIYIVEEKYKIKNKLNLTAPLNSFSTRLSSEVDQELIKSLILSNSRS